MRRGKKGKLVISHKREAEITNNTCEAADVLKLSQW